MTGEVRGLFLALEFEKDMYNPDGWMIGSSDDTDRCDMQEKLHANFLETGRKRLAAQAERVKQGLPMPRISFTQSANQDGFKVKV